jgi:hypothetical protein
LELHRNNKSAVFEIGQRVLEEFASKTA